MLFSILMVKQKSKMIISSKDITQIAVMVAIIIALSQIMMPLPGGVPFTLQTMAVMLAGIILGPIKGSLSVLIYIFMGAIGLPVFAGFSGGFSIILGPHGGYIIGFAAASVIIGLFSMTKKKDKKVLFYIKLLTGILIGQFIIFLFGTLWIMQVFGIVNFQAAAAIAVTPFIIPEIIKTILAIIFGVKIKTALKRN